MKTVIAIALAGTLLSGCAGRYVDLYVTPIPASSEPVSTRVLGTLTRLHTAAAGFRTTYAKASKEADLAQIPLLGAAVAVALIAVNKPTSGPDTVAKIGIGAGAYATGRSLAMPSGGPEAFRKGVDAINCVLAEGPSFVSGGVDADVAVLESQTVDLDTSMNLLAAAVAEDAVPANDAEKKALELARSNAKLALARAATASQAARSQLGAFANAPGQFESAAAAIFSALAAKTSVRAVIDVSGLAASWTKPVTTDGSAPPAGLARGSAAALIIQLEGSIDALDALTAAVTAKANGFQFADHLKAVAKCPALI